MSEIGRCMTEWRSPRSGQPMRCDLAEGHGGECRSILPLCPADARVAAWVKPFCAFKRGVRPCYAWEPVIFWRGRNPSNGHKHPPPVKGGTQTTPKDFLAESITLRKGLTGAKPARYCRWVLDLLGWRPGDEVVNLFPGTGAMTLAATGTDGLPSESKTEGT